MSKRRNVNILADQHHSHTLPPYNQSPYSANQPVLSPGSHYHQTQHHHQHQHPSQSLPALTSISNPPRYQGSAPAHTSSHTPPESHEHSDHGYSGPRSENATPLTRNHAEGAPPQGYQRASSPGRSQGHQSHSTSVVERPHMENGHSSQVLYTSHPAHPPPHHPDQQTMYPPPSHSGLPMVDHSYAPQHVYPSQGYLYPNVQLTNQNTRKKSMRASQACDKCRERKSKCDEQRPCATCKEQSLECHYKDSQPSKIDKSNAQLTETIQTVFEQMKVMTGQMELMIERVGSLEARVGPSGSESTKKDAMFRQPSRTDTPTVVNDRQLQETRVVENLRGPSSPGDHDYAEHTTAAHKLMRWPSIHALLPQDHRPENYPLKAEDRGVLRLYGRGEQKSREDNIAIGAESPAQSMGSDDFGGSPELPNNIHSHEYPGRPQSEPAYPLKMDTATLHDLYDRYKKHIHRLHPFLDIDLFGKYVRRFINEYSSDSNRYLNSPMVANGSFDSQMIGTKRKRSDLGPASLCGSDGGSKRARLQSERPKRTIINAIVYLVFAVGKVCQAQRIPGPLTEPIGKTGSSVGSCVPGASPMIMKPSPASPFTTTAGFTPPAGREMYGSESRRSSYEDMSAMVTRQYNNVDVIPGLDYYREAVCILGDYADANDLASAQARLLAALYKGQLGRVQESYSWLHLASRTCQYLIRIEGLNKTYGQRTEFNKTQNLTVLAFFTCVQLESDILAELDYPHSGSATMEDTVNWPNGVNDDEASRSIVGSKEDLEIINIYYSAQLFLRKHLNRIHVQIYNVDLARQDPRTLSASLDDLDWKLQKWRDMNPKIYWNDQDEPHGDIVVARLRAKYYGARYVITRPFLDYALHVMEKVQQGHRLEDITLDAHGKVRKQELVLFKAISTMEEETIMQKVGICIDSAMRSTLALDNVKDHRLIVTNIMGTAHAQFGNMLVLAATHRSSIDWVNRLVSREALGHLLERTIRFLKRIEESSATARIDIEFLTELQNNLGLTADY